MSGISPASAQAEATVAVFHAVQAALADDNEVDISFGFRWPPEKNDWVAIGIETESQIEPRNIGPDRQLDERITVTLSIGSWDPEFSQAKRIETFLRAFAILGRIQNHIRTQDITLGGVALWCLPGSSRSIGPTSDEERLALGEFTEIEATFVAAHRIRTR